MQVLYIPENQLGPFHPNQNRSDIVVRNEKNIEITLKVLQTYADEDSFRWIAFHSLYEYFKYRNSVKFVIL